MDRITNRGGIWDLHSTHAYHRPEQGLTPLGYAEYREFVALLRPELVFEATATATAEADIVTSWWVFHCAGCDQYSTVPKGAPLGLCIECGKAVTVTWPDGDDADAAEALLRLRPNPHNRNWLRSQGETVAVLAQENADHGI